MNTNMNSTTQHSWYNTTVTDNNLNIVHTEPRSTWKKIAQQAFNLRAQRAMLREVYGKVQK